MKPIATYTALLAMTLTTTVLHFGQGHHQVAIATLICGALTLLAFQGGLLSWPPRKDKQPPATVHILVAAMMVEAATAAAAQIASNAFFPGAIRITGTVVIFGLIGHLSTKTPPNTTSQDDN